MEHRTDGYDCWCGPQILAVCDDCDGVGCWKCGYQATDGSGEVTGLIEIDRSQVEEDERPIIIVHN